LSAVKEAEKCSVRVEDNIGLVHACARRYTGKGIEYEDLVQVGCIGLIKAAKGFDETRLVRFSTYAVPVILGEIKGVFRSGGAVRVSRSIKELGMRAQKLSDEIYLASGTRPKLSELSERLGADIEELTEAVCAMQMPLSVDAQITISSSASRVYASALTSGSYTRRTPPRAILQSVSYNLVKIVQKVFKNSCHG